MITKQTNKNKGMESSTNVSKLLPVSSVILAVHKIDYFGMLGILKFSVGSQDLLQWGEQDGFIKKKKHCVSYFVSYCDIISDRRSLR